MQDFRTAAWLACGALLFLSGCGSGNPPVAKASGRVTCGGQPVTSGRILFTPIPKSEKDNLPGKAATGEIDSDGTFELSTYGENDGAIIGKHLVTIIPTDQMAQEKPGDREQAPPKWPYPCPLNQPIEQEIVAGENELEIELSRGS